MLFFVSMLFFVLCSFFRDGFFCVMIFCFARCLFLHSFFHPFCCCVVCVFVCFVLRFVRSAFLCVAFISYIPCSFFVSMYFVRPTFFFGSFCMLCDMVFVRSVCHVI